MPHPARVRLRWGQGPTQPATCNAKWQVCTQACSPALLISFINKGRVTGGGGGGWGRENRIQ